ncbi:WD repeat-containing protein 36 [Bacillus rossius redtenbacheri]|uniref:WD repeat-containing protein 36 n=1 Tax=Bacillus rossius redtenbacheri TaxID=93214 RepID=UPI002FDD0DCA
MSKIFQRNRALGYVSNHVPLQVRYIKLRKENLVVTCVGRAFHTYGSSHFALLSVSGQHDEDISCVAADSYHVYTAAGSVVRAWRRGKDVKHEYPGHDGAVRLMLPFGPHLLTVDEGGSLRVWDVKAEEQHAELTFSRDVFEVTALVHPSTYANKVLLGSRQGGLELWNMRTCKRVHAFPGWESAVTVLEQAPAVDVVAVGLATGRIVLHNLRYDETVLELLQDWGAVTAISFRTDGHPTMVTGSPAGAVVLWDLEERRVLCQMENAHAGSVTGMRCFPGEPLMVTSSPDNTLKMWIFDLPDGGARLLRLREGHSAPPAFIRFHGSNGHNLLSAGADSTLRIFNTVNETFNKSLGKASYNRKITKKKGWTVASALKMPPIVAFTSEMTREKEWDNIAAIHQGIPHVTTWSYDKVKMGDLKLLPERFDSVESKSQSKVTATCVCLSQCGNFVVVGYSSGHADRFNIQSGVHRGSYGKPRAHEGPVRGVASDSLNQVVITGGSDCLVKFFHFNPAGSLVGKLDVEEPVDRFCCHRESSMLAVALEDHSVLVVDMDVHSVVRRFPGHAGAVTDLAFSPDARWLVTAGTDCSVHTWDLPSSQLVDCFQTESPCTSLSFSPTGSLLATTHVNYLGVYLWFNRTLYSHVSLKPVDPEAEPQLVDLPSSLGKPTSEENHVPVPEEPEFTSAQQINKMLITLSTLSTSRWQNLLNLDVIKRRNKPKEPPKAPKAAPFFLPTLPSLEMRFDLSDAVQKAGVDESRTFLEVNQNLTVFGKLLSKSAETDNFDPVLEKLMSMGPSAIDLEVSLLAPAAGGSVALMLQFMRLIDHMLDSRRNFELAYSYLGLFLKRHEDTVASEPELRTHASILREQQLSGWQDLQNKMLYNLCVVQALKTL